MVTIANCRDWQECQLLKSKLESAGISVFVPDEMSNLDGLILHFGGFRVQVTEEDVAAAGTVLETRKQSEEEAELGAAPNDGPVSPVDNTDRPEEDRHR